MNDIKKPDLDHSQEIADKLRAAAAEIAEVMPEIASMLTIAVSSIENLCDLAKVQHETLSALNNDRDMNFLARWIERGLFDQNVSSREALKVMAYYPGMPWFKGRWDVDHKPYSAEFYKAFPKAGPG